MSTHSNAGVAKKSPIIDGSDLTRFLLASLKGSDHEISLTIPTTDGESVTVMVKIGSVLPLRVDLARFAFTGETTQRRKVKGRYTPGRPHKDDFLEFTG